MKSKIILLVALFVTTIGYSQRSPNNTYLTSFLYEAKSGMIDKFESAAAKKN